MTTEKERDILTIEEAAARLQLSRGRCYQMAREGTLPGILCVGKRRVVDAKAVERLLQGINGNSGKPEN